MKKSIFFVVLVLFAIMIPAQEKEKEEIPVLPDEQQPQVQVQEPPVLPAEQTQVQAQEPPVLPAEQPQVQAAEPSPAPPVQPQGKNLKKIRFPQAFIHAGKEYPAGDYWLILAAKEGQPLFVVQNAQKELLFEDLAIVIARPGGRSGSSFWVDKRFMTEKEYFRVKVTTPGEWLLGYFLVKK